MPHDSRLAREGATRDIRDRALVEEAVCEVISDHTASIAECDALMRLHAAAFLDAQRRRQRHLERIAILRSDNATARFSAAA